MQTITSAQLETVTGGATPGTNDLSAWLPQGGGGGGAPTGGGGGFMGNSGGPLGGGPITSAGINASSKPMDPKFGQSPDNRVTSGPDQSWQQGLPGMFSAMGM